MADEMTTSGDKIQSLMDELKAALVEAGRDEDTVTAQMYALRMPEVNVLGNLADLQRLGANVAAEQMAGADAVEAAVQVSPVPPTVDLATTSSSPELTPNVLHTPTTSVAAAEPDLDDMTKAELEEEAKDRDVAVTSSMTKAEIIQAIRKGD